MNTLDFYSLPASERAYWLEEIGKSDWEAGKLLYKLIGNDELKKLCGEDTKVLLLTEGKALIAFCTYARQDEIDDPSMTPWTGFVYTFPEFRGKRRMGKLIEHTYALAKEEGFERMYISTGETGLYEKYGYSYLKQMKSIYGWDCRVYFKDIVQMDYSSVIGREVEGHVDRPLGSSHPRHPEMIYPLNYGYVDGVFAGDGAEQDVYLFGVEEPVKSFKGKVVGVIHRLNDCEDKWIVSVDGKVPEREEILKRTEFQEQYFMGELYL